MVSGQAPATMKHHIMVLGILVSENGCAYFALSSREPAPMAKK
jgi:hypothetical protein